MHNISYYKFLLAIPTLILLDEKGGLITTEGLTYVCNDQDGEVLATHLKLMFFKYSHVHERARYASAWGGH